VKYIDEFRNKKLIHKVADKIKKLRVTRRINIMEVCGTHTQNFFRFGLEQFLPENLNFIAGPGCPVCVCEQEFIDEAISYARHKDTAILTFADMLRVPGTISTLERERAARGNILVVYSPLTAVTYAKANPNKKVIFLAVGFETTAPTVALSILRAKKERIKNLFFLFSLKLIPPAMELLVKDKRLKIDGFLCPGHVSAIIGTGHYSFIPRDYGIGCCVAGFEPLDILEGIYILVRQIAEKKPCVVNQYGRVVRSKGNIKARSIMYRVFKTCDVSWRGFGIIPKSGLELKDEYVSFNANRDFPIDAKKITIDNNRTRYCKCADVLKGLISPLDCPLFSKVCNPNNPVGPCMVSQEGACNAYYRYRR